MKSRNIFQKTAGILTLIVLSSSLYAQQIPLYSQFYFNKFLYNPALTGQSGTTDGYAFGRRQYTAVDGYQTAGLAISGAPNDGKIGVGLYYVNDISGIRKSNSVYGNYAYNVKFSETTKLSFGLALGVVSNQYDLSSIITTDPNDPVLRLLNQPAGAALDASLGVNFEVSGFNIGVSVPQVLNNSQNFTDHYNSTVSYDLQNHIMAMASYDINVSDNLKIQPLVLYKYTANAPSQIDINVMADFLNKGWLGVGFRDGYGMSFMGGVRVANNLKFGYCYDMSTGEYSTALGGTHEFLLGVTLGKKDNKEAEEEAARAKMASDKKQKELDDKIQDLEKQMADYKSRPVEKDTLYIVKTEPKKPENTGGVKPDPNSGKTTGQFILVAGSFNKEQNATVFFNQLLAKGHSPYVYYDKGSKTYYVHVGKFSYKEDAKADIANHKGLSVWVKTLN